MVKNKKRKGSTLVTVLGLAVVFMTFSAVIISSVMSTMKANTNQKIKEDLSYAAESGLEIARSYLNGKTTVTQADIDAINARMKSVLVDKNNDSIPDGDIGSVKLVSPVISGGSIVNPPTRAGEASSVINTFTVKVRAEKKGDNNFYEELGTNYNEIKSGNGNGSIFEHSVVASDGKIEIQNCRKQNCSDLCPNKDKCCTHCYGHLNPNYASGSLSSSQGTSINGVSKPVDDKIKVNDYQEIKFINNTTEVKKLYMKTDKPIDIINDLSKLELKSDTGEKIEIMNVEISVTDLSAGENSKVQKIKVDGVEKSLIEFESMTKSPVMLVKVKGIATIDLPILMTNAKNVELEINGGASTIKYGIWLNKGEINVSGRGALHLAYATLFGSSIKYSTEMAMDISYPSGHPLHGMITDLDKLNTIIEAVIPNWNTGGSVGGNSGKSEIKFKGEFSN